MVQQIDELGVLYDDTNVKRFLADVVKLNTNMAATAAAANSGSAGFATFDTTIKKTIAGIGVLTGRVQQSADGMQRVSVNIDQVAQKTEKAAKSMVVSWQSVRRVITGVVLARSLGKLSQAFNQATRDAHKFNRATYEIRAIAGPASQSIDSLQAGLVRVSNAFGLDILDAAEAQYQAVSNQIQGAADSTQFLEAAAKLSLSTVSSLTDSVSILSSVLNAYGKSTAEAEKISAQLFVTIQQGRLRLSEIADSFGRVAILGAKLKIPVEDLLAALQTLTIQGIQVSEAMSGLRGVLSKVIRPSEALKEAVRDMGFESSLAAVEVLGLVGFIEQLNAQNDGSILALGEQFNRVRANVAAAGLATDKFRKNQELTINAVDAFQKAVEEIQEAPFQKLNVELTKIRNTLLLFGKTGLDGIVQVTEAMGGMAKVSGDLGQVIVATAGAWAAVALAVPVITGLMSAYTLGTITATGVTVGFKGALLSLWAVMIAHPFTLVAVAAAAVGAALATLAKNAWNASQQLESAFEAAADRSSQAWFDAMQQITKDIESNVQASFDIFDTVIDDYERSLQQLLASFRAAVRQVDRARSAEEEAIQRVVEAEIELAKNRDRGLEATRLITKELERLEGRLDEQVKLGIPDERDFDQTLRQYNRLASELQRVGEKGIKAQGAVWRSEIALVTAEGEKRVRTLGSAAKGRAGEERIPIAAAIEASRRAQEKELELLKRVRELRSANVKASEEEFEAQKKVIPAVEEYLGSLQEVKAINQTIAEQTAVLARAFGIAVSEGFAGFGAQTKEQLESLKEYAAVTEALQGLKNAREVEPTGLNTYRFGEKLIKDYAAAQVQVNKVETAVQQLAKAQEIFNTDGVELSVEAMGELYDTVLKGHAAFKSLPAPLQAASSEAGNLLDRVSGVLGNQEKLRQKIADTQTVAEGLADKIAPQALGVQQAIQAFKDVGGPLGDNQKAVAAALESVRRQIEEVSPVIEQARATLKEITVVPVLESVGVVIEQNKQGLKDQLKLLQEFEDAKARLKERPFLRESPAETQVDELQNQLDAIREQQKQLDNQTSAAAKPVENAVARVAAVGQATGELAKGAQTLVKGTGEGVADLNTQLAGVSGKMSLIGQQGAQVGQGMKLTAEGTFSVVQSVDRSVSLTQGRVNQLIAQAQYAIALAAQANAASSGVVLANAGGFPTHSKMRRFNSGGLAAGGGLFRRFAAGGVGTDLIPALLSEGEVVIRSQEAASFLPQLIALNNSSQPLQRFESGGNVSVGDVNVTVQGGDTGEQTVREIGQALRREIKRGVLRLT